MGKQNVPVKARRGNAGAMAALARKPTGGSSHQAASSSDKKHKHGGIGCQCAGSQETHRA
jgi:hypothetical protein